MRREFKIQPQEKDDYLISEIDAFKSIVKSCECSPTYTFVEGALQNVTVFCDPNFMHELIAYYHWSENHPNNYYEDAYRIAGQVLHNPEINSTILIARFLIKVVASDRSKTAVSTSPQGVVDCMRQASIINDCLEKSDMDFISDFGPLQIIGAGHSHPNLSGIDVNMSGIDVEDHQKCLDYDDMPWLTQIVDPNRGLSAFYFGKTMKTPKVVYMFYPGDDMLFELRTSFMYKRKPTNIIPKHNRIIFDNNDDNINSSETPSGQGSNAFNDSFEENVKSTSKIKNWFEGILTHCFKLD